MATFDATKNFAKVTVSTGYDAAATSIVLATGDGAKLPQPSTDGEFNLVWWNNTDYSDPTDDPNREIVRCTARSTDTLTVTRAQEGEAASTKNTSDKTYRMALTITKKVIDDITTGKQDALTFGIADNNAVEIDSATVATSDYAKFTANGLEGKSYSEVRTDLNVADGATANSKATGAEIDAKTNDEKFVTPKALDDQTVLLKKAGGTMTGELTLVTGTTTVAPIKMVAGTNLTTPVAGVIEFDGTDFYLSV